MAIPAPKVLGVEIVTLCPSFIQSLITEGKKCAKHHERPMGSLGRRPGGQNTEARLAQAELRVLKLRA